jgi:translocation and assembly module TamB
LNALPTPPLPPDRSQFPLEYRPAEKARRRWTWRRVAAWVGAGLLILIIVVVVGVALLLYSRSGHNYVLRTAQQKATAALGSQVEVRDFGLSLSNLGLDLYGVTVHGAEPHANPPLLQVEHIAVGVKIVSLLQRTWYLRNLEVERPVVRMLVDRNGIDNLPKTQKSSSQGQTSLFDLGVRHAVLNNGEIYYNNRKSVLNADLHDLSFQATFDPGPKRYSGTIGYRNGHLQSGNFNPMPHDLQARFELTPAAFTLNRAVLTSGPSQFVLSAELEDFNNPRAQAQYTALIDAGEFRRITKNPSLPLGVIRMTGSMQYQSQPNRPMLETLTVAGDLRSRVLRVRMPSFQGEISDIGARYTLAKGNLEVRNLGARLLGGELSGALSMRNLTGATQSHLSGDLRGISLAEAKKLVSSPALQRVAVSGKVNADADATWGKTVSNLVARANATIRAAVAPSSNVKNSVPLNGVIHARYAAGPQQISLTQTSLRTPQTSLTLNGTVSRRSNLQLQLQANDLRELETIAENFRTPVPGEPMPQLGLYGSASFVGTVRGSTTVPQLTGQLTGTNLRVRGSNWRVLRTNVELSPSLAKLANGELQPATRGRISFDVSAGLKQWSFTETSPIQVGLDVNQLNVADLAKAAGSQAPVTGTLSANLSLRGSEISPVGQGRLSLTRAKVASEPIQSVDLQFQGTGNEVRGNLSVRIPAGGAQSAFTLFPKQKGYEAQLQALGIRLDRLETLRERNIPITGVLNLRASGRGTFSDPQLAATLQVPALQVQNQKISSVNLQANVANHVANVALDSQAVNTFLRARGTLKLTGDYYADAALDTQSIPLQPLVAAYAPSQSANISGQTELHATLRGPLKNKSALDAHVTIPILQVKYKDAVQIGAASPIHVDFTNGVLVLQRTNIRGTATDIQLQASIPTNSAAPVSLLALGTIDLRLAQLFSPDISSSGQIRFDINSYGQRANPDLQGQIRIINANLATGEVPIGLQDGNGVLTLTKDRLNITEFRGIVGGGTVTARGGVVYKPTLQFDMALGGEHIRLLYPDGVRETLDLDLTLRGSQEAAQLGGQVRVADLSFTPDFDLTSFMGQFSSETAPPPAQGFSQNLQLNIAVQSSSGVNLVSRTLSLQAAANLEVRGTAAEPVLLGRINLNGGDLIFRGNRYILQGGTIDFVNPAKTEPVLNVAVNTTIQQYNITMRFEGPADHMHTNYASDPALPPSDIINLLAFGKTSEASAANPAPPGNLGAESVVASQVSSQVTSRVEKIAGISQLSIDPVLGGNAGQKNAGARVTLQQRVTGNIFVTFSTDVTSTQNQVIQLQYQLSPRTSVSATRDQNGGFGFDTRFRKNW